MESYKEINRFVLDGGQSVAHASLCNSLGSQFDGERVVFFTCRKAWYERSSNKKLFFSKMKEYIKLETNFCSLFNAYRTLPNSPYIEFHGLLIHGARRMVCGAQSHRQGDLVGDVFGARWYSAMRAIEESCLVQSS